MACFYININAHTRLGRGTNKGAVTVLNAAPLCTAPIRYIMLLNISSKGFQ